MGELCVIGDMKTFADKINGLIGTRYAKQQVLADLSGVPQSTLSSLLKGSKPTLAQAWRLAKVIGWPLEYLARDDMEEEPDPAEREAIEYIVWACKDLGITPRDLVRRLVSAGMAKVMPEGGPANSGSPPYAGFEAIVETPGAAAGPAQEQPKSRHSSQG